MEHALKEYPEYRELRKEYWLTEVALNRKLYGTKEELHTTVRFTMRKDLAVISHVICSPPQDSRSCPKRTHTGSLFTDTLSASTTLSYLQ